MVKKKDVYEIFAGALKNEPDLEEELEQEGIDAEKAEIEHFEEDE